MADNITNSSYDTESSTDLGGDFSSLSLSDISPTKKSAKKPKILHFSDGTMEEYSTDEEEEAMADVTAVDPKTLSWRPWMAYWATHTGKSVLSTCDYVGEGIANFLGITSQKYFYEIEEYKRAMKQEEDEKREAASQMSGWTTETTDLGETPEIQKQFVQKNFEINDCSLVNGSSEEKAKY